MKKINSIILMSILLTFSLFYLSCEKKSVNECSTCNSNEFVNIKVNLFSDNLEFKRYDDKINDFHLGLSVINNADFQFFSKKIKEVINIDFNQSELVGFCLVTDNPDKESYFVENANIKGIILYFRTRENKMIVKFMKKENNQYIENIFSNIQIGCITTNNIFDLTTIFFDDQSKMVYLLVSSNYKVDTKSNNNEIDNKLKKLKANIFSNKIDPTRSCGLGCTANNGGSCALGNSGEFFCKKDKNCPKEDAQKTLENANILSYDYKTITEDLYYFRGNYLKEVEGGQKIIDDYYDLGKNLPSSFYTIENCKKLFNLLNSDVTKITNDLTDNPNSDSILINDELKMKLINYLLDIKKEYSDNYSKDKIDNLINKVTFFTNKSNDFITKNLNSY